jgi:hypothetical protein
MITNPSAGSLSAALNTTAKPAMPAGITAHEAWARLCSAVTLIKQHNAIAEAFGRSEVMIPADQFNDINVGA